MGLAGKRKPTGEARTERMELRVRPSAKQVIQRAMALSDVIDLRSRLVTQLSSGETQRVLVAMVLAQGPRIMLLDEATSHLDINHRLEVMQVVQRLNRDEGMTVLIVTHKSTRADLDTAIEAMKTTGVLLSDPVVLRIESV